MRVDAVEVIRVELPLVRPFRTAFGTQTSRSILLVRLQTDLGCGWGECAAHAEPYFNSEFTAGTEIVLANWLGPVLIAAGDFSPSHIPDLLGRVRGWPAAKAGIEMAALDAASRADGLSISQFLGGTRDAVDVGVSVGMTDTIDELKAVVASYVDAGYARVKLKIEPGWDVEPVCAIREQYADLLLQVDANASYPAGALEPLQALDGLGLLMIEQPFATDDLDSHSRLAGTIDTPVCLDESITSPMVTRHALDQQACSIVNIKVGRVGGLLTSVAIHDLCRARDIAVWCGGMLESGIGRAANVALASLPGFILPGDISASDRYFARDLTEPFRLSGSSLLVPSAPGLGVAVDEHMVRKLGSVTATVRRES
jgi:O-succinylbenzoate synthase